ncbi:MAG: alpha-E domain-containing protein [Deltaproteobacteria bacterium]|nr:alpha-E domain-containing protein [Deltaproteobacteria bacterium]MBV8453647.1 alpha-E domain-containing protein [Deltaproteobacteria bacterium]
MLKRISGNLFWLARYLERAEWRARLLDVNYRLLVENSAEAKDEWWPLLAVTGEWDLYAEHYANYDERSILGFFTFDPHNLSSIASCIEYARENCRAVRNRISSEVWLEINMLHLEAKQWSSERMLSRGVVLFFAELRERFYGIAGAMQSTLPRDTGYDFLSLGRWLEAAENVTRLLDTKYHFLLPSPADVGSSLDISQWAALLRSASALEAYRNAYGNSISVERIVEFMLFDAAFPRAARFCVERLETALNRIASACPVELRAAEENPTAKVPTAYALGNRLRAGNASAAMAGGLHEYVLEIQADCATISDEIYTAYCKYE